MSSTVDSSFDVGVVGAFLLFINAHTLFLRLCIFASISRGKIANHAHKFL